VIAKSSSRSHATTFPGGAELSADAEIPDTTEIACDESGWEGTNLVTGNSEVIAYASVGMSRDEARECLETLLGHIGQNGPEYKASHVLRAASAADLAWLLGTHGPLHGRARVHLTDKAFFVVSRVLDVFVGESVETTSAGMVQDPRVARMARTLCQTGPAVFGPEKWRAFLAASNAMLRISRRLSVSGPVDAFYAQLDAMQGVGVRGDVDEVLDALQNARSTAYAVRSGLFASHVLQPALEPLIPALARTVLYWMSGRQEVVIVHDEQSALTRRRLAVLEQTLAEPPLQLIPARRDGRFIQLRQVDSRSEPRVQIADILAGVARAIATEELHGTGEPERTRLLQRYVDPDSHWWHEPSWQRLCPPK
jgi:hypothetical protein